MRATVRFRRLEPLRLEAGLVGINNVTHWPRSNPGIYAQTRHVDSMVFTTWESHPYNPNLGLGWGQIGLGRSLAVAESRVLP